MSPHLRSPAATLHLPKTRRKGILVVTFFSLSRSPKKCIGRLQLFPLSQKWSLLTFCTQPHHAHPFRAVQSKGEGGWRKYTTEGWNKTKFSRSRGARQLGDTSWHAEQPSGPSGGSAVPPQISWCQGIPNLCAMCLLSCPGLSPQSLAYVYSNWSYYLKLTQSPHVQCWRGLLPMYRQGTTMLLFCFKLYLLGKERAQKHTLHYRILSGDWGVPDSEERTRGRRR